MENTKFENKNICRECGGKCCKKCGCDYSTDNFQDLSMKALEEILSEGKISIVAALNIKKSKNGNKFIIPFLYLRARNKKKKYSRSLIIKVRVLDVDLRRNRIALTRKTGEEQK